jgi:hypothetical protein
MSISASTEWRRRTGVAQFTTHIPGEMVEQVKKIGDKLAKDGAISNSSKYEVARYAIMMLCEIHEHYPTLIGIASGKAELRVYAGRD